MAGAGDRSQTSSSLTHGLVHVAELPVINRFTVLRSRTLPLFSWNAGLFSFRLIIFRTVGFVGWVKFYLKFYGESLTYICIFDVIKCYFPWHVMKKLTYGVVDRITLRR